MIMFKGEIESLKAIEKTNCIRVPKPIKAFEHESVSYLVLEYCNIKSYSNVQAELGTSLAKYDIIFTHHVHKKFTIIVSTILNIRMHLNNLENGLESLFGFHVSTSCGFIPQSNEWKDNWISFYINKLNKQIKLVNRDYDQYTQVMSDLWPALKEKIPYLFKDIDVKPS